MENGFKIELCEKCGKMSSIYQKIFPAGFRKIFCPADMLGLHYFEDRLGIWTICDTCWRKMEEEDAPITRE